MTTHTDADYQLLLADGDDGLIEVDWGTFTETCHLQEFTHLFGFNTDFGAWRSIRYLPSGRVRGMAPRATPARLVRCGTVAPAVTKQSPRSSDEATALRPVVLERFAETGVITQAIREALRRLGSTRSVTAVYAWLTSDTSPHYDPAWHEAYLRLKEAKPWKQAA